MALYSSTQGSVLVLFSFILLLLFFGYILLILTFFVNYVYHLIEKKIEQVCEIYYFRGHTRTVYKISGLEVGNHKKIIVVVNCRTGYKFEIIKKPYKILTSKLKFLPENLKSLRKFLAVIIV